MKKPRLRGPKQGPTKELLDAIDKKDFVTIYESLTADGSHGSNIVQQLSKNKFYSLWECTIRVTVTLPPLCKPLELSPAQNETSNSQSPTHSAEIHGESEKDEPMEVENEEVIRALPEDQEEVTKMVVTLMSFIIPQFASKNKEPSSLIAVLPVFKLLLVRNLYIPEILSISEHIWRKRWTGHEILAGETLRLLLQKALSPTATKKDVKNVVLYKEIIDDSASWFKNLKPHFIECLTNKKFLSESTSLSFLAKLFCLTPEITIECFEEIKLDIVKPTATKQKARCFGRILGLACLTADETMQEVIKEKCIQFFAWKFIRLQWSSDLRNLSPLGHLLNESLMELHVVAKQHPAVLSIVMDAYDPILWRHLVISNNNFRANATRLLFDLFPIERPRAGRVENEKLLLTQYNLMMGLLEDDSDLVRLIATKEVCKILATFWSCLPNKFRANTTHCIVTKLCFDRSAVEIRKQSLLGLAHAVKNGPYSLCTYIGPRLKQLQLLIYDESKVVSRAMLQLLLALQDVKHPNANGIVGKVPTCWDVVPPKMIVRLLGSEEYDAPIMQPLVKLLFQSLHPRDPVLRKTRSVVKRVSWLIRLDSVAARNFYQNSSEVLSVPDAIRFMQKVLIVLTQFCRRNESTQKLKRKKTEGINRKRKAHMEDKENANIENHLSIGSQSSQSSQDSSDLGGLSSQDDLDGSQDTSGHITLQDPNIVSGLLDVIVILWLKHQKVFLHENIFRYSTKLMMIAKDALQILFRYWRDHEMVMHPLLLLASLLPKKRVRHLVSYSHSQLKILAQKEEPVCRNTANLLLTVLCNWNCGDEVLEMIGDALQQTLENGVNSDQIVAKKKKGCQVAFEETSKVRPEVVLEYLHLLFVHPINHDYIVSKAQRSMQDLVNKIDLIKPVIQQRMEEGMPIEMMSDHLMHLFLLRYVKLIALMQSTPETGFDSSVKYIQILDWAEEFILPYTSRLHLDSEEPLTERIPLCALLLVDILRGATYMVHFDKTSSDLCMSLVQFCEKCLEKDVAIYLVPAMLCISAALGHHGVCVNLGNRHSSIPDDFVNVMVPRVVEKALDKCNDSEKLTLSLCEEQDNVEVEINIDMLINAFVKQFPKSNYNCSEPVFRLCTSFIRAILKVTMSESTKGLPHAANYLLTAFLNSPVDSDLVTKPILDLINGEFGKTEAGCSAVGKLLNCLTQPHWKGIISSHQAAKCIKALQQCSPSTMEEIEEDNSFA